MSYEIINEICDMLNSYTGRDKILKTLCYTAKLASAIHSDNGNGDLSKNFAIFSTKMTQTRSTLRLLDDLPMIKYTLDYGLGSKEPDSINAAIGVLTNIADHLYYSADKVKWALEAGILKWENQSKASLMHSVFWSFSVYMNLMKTLRLVYIMELQKQNIDKLENENAVALNKLEVKQQMELISVLRLTLDFAHVISTLPTGYLWGGKLTNYSVGLIGSASSLIGIYQYFARIRMAKN